jgi:hypothetical protein
MIKMKNLQQTAIFYVSHPQEEKPFEKVNLSDSFAALYSIYVPRVYNENTHDEVCYSNVEEVFDYVDFHGVNNVLSSSHDLKKILNFTRKTTIETFFNTFMAREEK